jgi:ribosomal protein S18 acetylase RimI-like enzyme
MFEVPLPHTSDTELGLALQENLFGLFRAMCALPGSALHEVETLSYHCAAAAHRMFRGVWGARLTHENADEAIAQAIAWFEARQAPTFYWWLGPGSAPDDLPERLAARRLSLNMDGEPIMAAELAALRESPPPEDFTAARAADARTLADFSEAFAGGYGLASPFGQAWAEATARLGGERAPWELYVGYWRGQPVTTSILFRGAGVGGIYGVSTRPEMRGRGFGGAITLRALLAAREAGERYGALFASPLGAPVYRRLGLHETPCRIGRYLWEKESTG